MNKCASCSNLTFDVVKGDRCYITGRQANRSDNAGMYCKNYEMKAKTEEEAIAENDFLRNYFGKK